MKTKKICPSPYCNSKRIRIIGYFTDYKFRELRYYECKDCKIKWIETLKEVN